eukprot:3900512-Pyramimonas_sp.AAC.1
MSFDDSCDKNEPTDGDESKLKFTKLPDSVDLPKCIVLFLWLAERCGGPRKRKYGIPQPRSAWKALLRMAE